MYCTYTGHGFVAVFLAEKMNLRERDAGGDDLITDGRECHYTVACKGKTDGGNELRSDFTFADGLMQHVVLSERSKARKSLQVRCNLVLHMRCKTRSGLSCSPSLRRSPQSR